MRSLQILLRVSLRVVEPARSSLVDSHTRSALSHGRRPLVVWRWVALTVAPGVSVNFHAVAVAREDRLDDVDERQTHFCRCVASDCCWWMFDGDDNDDDEVDI